MNTPTHVLTRFEQACQAMPAELAVSEPGRSLSYAQLDAAAWALAARLRAHGVMRGDLVCLFGQRSADYAIATLAAWRCGAAYVPVAMDTPLQRVAQILAQAPCRAVVTLGDAVFGGVHDTVLACGQAAFAPPLPDAPDPSAADLAYVIFTSGSSGTPKGVMIGHDTLGAMTAAYCAHFSIVPSERVSAVANIAFDASVIEWWPALSRGASVHVAAGDTVRSPAALVDWLGAHRITFSWLPTPLVEILIGADDLILPACLRMIETAGQRLHARPRNWTVALENSYGPTEATVIATSSLVAAHGSDAPDIGRPLAGVEVYVLDEQMRQVAQGEAGEIHIGGAGVARGYLNDPDLSARKFRHDPFTACPGARMYATGDLGRWNSDGVLEFLGRIDQQVKLRGHRVELGDVEFALSSVEGISQAACRVIDGTQTQLLACYTVRAGAFVREGALRSALAGLLPAYMLPDLWLELPALPLTPNGKLDRAALPIPATATTAAPAPSSAALAPDEAAFLEWFQVRSGLALEWDQDFFRAGGNSIGAIVLLEALRREQGLHLTFPALFQGGAPAQVHALLRSAKPAPAEPVVQPRPSAQRNRAPLSASQRSIYFLSATAPNDRAYHAKARLIIDGPACFDSMRLGLQDVTLRHSIYRTAIVVDDALPWQAIVPEVTVELPQIDLRHSAPALVQSALDELLNNEVNRPFALDQAPLARWAWVLLPAGRCALLHVEHHIVHDGWSYNLFLGDLLHAYRARQAGLAPEWDQAAVDFADFAASQDAWLSSPVADTDRAYWQRKLAGAPATIALPINGDPQRTGGQTIRVAFARERWERMTAFCRLHHYTPFSFVYSAFAYVLARYTQDEDLCIGSAFANRSWQGAERIVGMMINTVVLRCQLDHDDSVHALLRRNCDTCVEAQSHQAFPFENLVQLLNPDRSPGDNPLFQVFMGFHDSPLPALTLPGMGEISLTEAVDSASSKFDLSLVVIPRHGQEGEGDPVHMLWEFRHSRLAPWFVEALIGAFEHVVDQFLEQPDAPLAQVRLGALDAMAATPQPITPLLTPWQRLASAAAASPQHCAIEFGPLRLSYATLLRDVEHKAARLAALGVAAGELVGVCLPRGPAFVAWLFAIERAGAAFLPLDPHYPPARLAYIAEHSKMCLLVGPRDGLPFGDPSLVIDGESDGDAALPLPDAATVTHDMPAYVIYTSGSTGAPKGVVVNHGNLHAFLEAMGSMFALTADARWAAVTSFSFDISILECFLPLGAGATLVLACEAQTRDAGLLATLLDEHAVTHLQATPSTWRALLDTGWHAQCAFVGLCGGEALDAVLAHACVLRGIDLHNMYGPTETTIWSCTYRVRHQLRQIPIGNPIAGTYVHVLDRRRRPVPVGAIGELWIGGAGVSQGYLHAPELTHERFIPNPFGQGRLYASGDQVSMGPDGTLLFHGRNDNQVKVRGFRIEIGEVERVLAGAPGVRACAVAVRSGPAGAVLAAYVATDGVASATLLEQHCSEQLPAYMVPTLWTQLAALPLTPNGKLDRSALPEPGPVATARAPQGATELALAELYQPLFGQQTIDADTGFYALGGHSLLAMRLVARINRQFGADLSVAQLLRLASIAAIARHLDSLPPAPVAIELTL